MALATGRAPAKAILMGEHFVVHGSPALAVPVHALQIRVTLKEGAPQPLDDHLHYCLSVAQEQLGNGARLPERLEVESTIPMGTGLGSSAALSLAVARAVAAAAGRQVAEETLRELSMRCERRAHGRPSGIDTEVCLTGRPVWLVPGQPPEPLDAGEAPRIGLIVALASEGVSTAGMIARVERFRQAAPERFQELQRFTGRLTTEARERLLDGDAARLGLLMAQQHETLREIGVSSPELDRAASRVTEAGAAGAKLSGSGGGGVVIAVATADELPQVAARARRAGLDVLSAARITAPAGEGQGS